MNYNDYLLKCNVLTEEEFNTIISLFPRVNDEDVDIDEYSGRDYDDLCKEICNAFLIQFDYAYCDSVDYINRTLVIEDVNTFEDLEEIKKTLSKWTIKNYDLLKKEITEYKDDFDRDSLIETIKGFSTKKLKQIVDQYDD